MGRINKDKYYTKTLIANWCVNQSKKYLDISYEENLIIEPSAGNGSFIGPISKIVRNYKFYDIEPENPLIKKRDYLYIDNDKILSKGYSRIM